MDTIETEAQEWLRKNRSKNKNIGAKTQRVQIAASVLPALIMLSNSTYNKQILIKEAYQWADLLLENA